MIQKPCPAVSAGKNVSSQPARVRHHTSSENAKSILGQGQINPTRPPYGHNPGVFVEQQPFGNPATGKARLGSANDGAYVEFDAPPNMVNLPQGGFIPTEGMPLNISTLNPQMRNVRKLW